MTPKESVLILAMVGGSDVQVQVRDRALFVSPKPGEDRLHPDLLLLGIRGDNYAERCQSLLQPDVWERVKDKLRIPLLMPLVAPRLESGQDVALALVATRQQPAHPGDTWAAALVIQRVLKDRFEDQPTSGRLLLIEQPELLLDQNPADYDVAQRHCARLVAALDRIENIDKIVVAPTGGTPAFAAMMIAAIGGGEVLGRAVRWEYVPRGSNKSIRLAAPGLVVVRRLADSILGHARAGRIDVAVSLAEGFPYRRQQADIVSWLRGHAALAEADYDAAAIHFRQASSPAGITDSEEPAFWHGRALTLAGARQRIEAGTGRGEHLAEMVEFALARAEALRLRGDRALALLALDAAFEQLALLCLASESGNVPDFRELESGADSGTRPGIVQRVQGADQQFASWFCGPSAALRRERNRLFLTHGHRATGNLAEVPVLLDQARGFLSQFAGRKPWTGQDWLEAVCGYVERCLEEVDLSAT